MNSTFKNKKIDKISPFKQPHKLLTNKKTLHIINFPIYKIKKRVASQ